MAGESYEERRRHPRQQEPTKLTSSAPEIFHRIIDISIGGLRVLASTAHPVGTRIPIQLRMSGGQVMNLMTEVAWVQRVMDGRLPTNEIGLRFLDLTDGDRILVASIL